MMVKKCSKCGEPIIERPVFIYDGYGKKKFNWKCLTMDITHLLWMAAFIFMMIAFHYSDIERQEIMDDPIEWCVNTSNVCDVYQQQQIYQDSMALPDINWSFKGFKGSQLKSED